MWPAGAGGKLPCLWDSEFWMAAFSRNLLALPLHLAPSSRNVRVLSALTLKVSVQAPAASTQSPWSRTLLPSIPKGRQAPAYTSWGRSSLDPP
uniref:Uncharacterized protein n=1 Tax=Sphenodon punctatus TaxID=8508 RepID=A0A8D0L3N5_SPHPU